jgi:hypothetical protein
MGKGHLFKHPEDQPASRCPCRQVSPMASLALSPVAAYPGWYGAEIRIGTIVSPQWMRSTAWSRTTDGK